MEYLVHHYSLAEEEEEMEEEMEVGDKEGLEVEVEWEEGKEKDEVEEETEMEEEVGKVNKDEGSSQSRRLFQVDNGSPVARLNSAVRLDTEPEVPEPESAQPRRNGAGDGAGRAPERSGARERASIAPHSQIGVHELAPTAPRARSALTSWRRPLHPVEAALRKRYRKSLQHPDR